MSKLTNIGGRVRYSIERFDGGRNVKDSPSRIPEYDSPDSLNVVHDKQGSVETRNGSLTFNTQAIGSFPIDGMASYNQTMVAWANGDMYRASGTTFVTVPSAQGKFTAGRKIASVVYQGILFCSDGSTGAWRYHAGDSFYNMGLVLPSAPTGASVGAGSLSTGTYYYGVSFVNTQAVESEIGSISAGITTTNSATVRVNSIPVGSSLAGVAKRRIYRASSTTGIFRYLGEIADNTTVTYDDTIANDQEGQEAVLDSTAPTSFNTIGLHKERLFFDDAANSSFIRWTDFGNPYVSQAENFRPINKNDGDSIQLVLSNDNVLTIFKDNLHFFIDTIDPSDDLTWRLITGSSNLGIVGPKAFAKVENGMIFVGRQNYRITGFHWLSGLTVLQQSDGKLKTRSISEKIQQDMIALPQSYWANIALTDYKNKIYAAVTRGTDTRNKNIFWFDEMRIGDEGQAGSWALWDGIEANHFVTHLGLLYAGGSASTGKVFQLETSTYSDSGSAINSYFYTKKIGGDQGTSLDAYVKDIREVFVWFAKLGNYKMNIKWRLDGDTSTGTGTTLNLQDSSSLWDTLIWDSGVWDGTRDDVVERLPIGKQLGKTVQFRFDNQNTLNQGFRVHRIEIGMNVRRRR